MNLLEKLIYELNEKEITLSNNAENMKTLVKKHLDFSEEHFRNMSSKRVRLLVPAAERSDMIDKLEEIPGFEYDPDMRGSSIGGMRYKDVSLLIKPLEKQGRASAGVQNEDDFERFINNHANEDNPITIIFRGNNRIEEVDKVIKAKGVGTQTTKYKKTDIVLERENKPDYNISIKQANAKYWESADARYKNLINDFIEEVDNGDHPEVYFEPFKTKRGEVKKGIYTMMSSKTETKIAGVVNRIDDEDEVKEIIFGENDEVDSVITSTFKKSDFDYDEENQTLEVKVKSVITDLTDVRMQKAWPWLRIRHDSTRTSSKGLRALVEMEKYILKRDSDDIAGNVIKLKN